MKKSGFTLVEVIVSIVLVSVIMVSMLASLVKLRDTYTVIHENSDVIVYTSSIARVINNDLMKNNGIRYANCTPNGLECEFILGNDQKRKLEIIKEGEDVDLCDYRNRRGKDATHERITTTLKYTNTSELGNEGELIYIRTLTLDRYTEYSNCIDGTQTDKCEEDLKNNCKKGTVTTEGYNFYDMNVPDQNLYYGDNNLVDAISKVNIRIWDGKNEESTKYDIVLYSSGRYDDSELVGNTYKIALDTNGATNSGTVELDEVFGVAYFDSEKSHSSKNILRKIEKPEKIENGNPMAFLGYYYYKGSADTLGTQIIDSKGTIVASSRIFRNDIELKNLEGLSEEEKQAHERVVAMWEECSGGYRVEDGECVAETYTVELDKNGGTGGINSYTASYKSLVPDISSSGLPSKVGYKFSGYYEGTTEYNDETGKGKVIYNHTNGITITAKWNPNTYQVLFNVNGGNAWTGATCGSGYTFTSGSNTCAKSVTYGLAYDSMPTPIRTGYTFDGWYTSASGGTKIETSTTVAITSTQTLYAHWKANTYQVTFNVNGGNAWTSTTCGSGYTFTSGSNTCVKNVTYGSTYGSMPTPTRTGYTFDGWYTSTSGGTKISTSTNVAITSAQTLYAHWTVKAYQVTFNVNGGNAWTSTTCGSGYTFTSSSKACAKNVTYSSTYGSMPTPTRTGNAFEGWYTSASGGTKIETSTNVTITSAQTLYAHWKDETKPTVKITAYNYDSSKTNKVGSTTLKSQSTFTSDGTYTVSSDWLNSGVTFKIESSDNDSGIEKIVWKWNVTGSLIDTGSEYNGSSSPSTYTTDLAIKYPTFTGNGYRKGQWVVTDNEGNVLTITIVAKVDTTKPTATYTTTTTQASLKCEDNIGLSGYYFGTKSSPAASDYTSASGTSKSWTSNMTSAGTYYVFCKDVVGNVSSSSKTYYSVAYNANGGTGAPATQLKVHGVNLTLSNNTLNRKYSTFTGWNTASNGSGVSYSKGGSYTGNANLTLYAQYKCDGCHINNSTGDKCVINYGDGSNNDKEKGYAGKITAIYKDQAGNEVCHENLLNIPFKDTQFGNYSMDDWINNSNHGYCSDDPLSTMGFYRYFTGTHESWQQICTSVNQNYTTCTATVCNKPPFDSSVVTQLGEQLGFHRPAGESETSIDVTAKNSSLLFFINFRDEGCSLLPKEISNIMFKMNGGSYKSLKQLVNDGVIEPLVLINAADFTDYTDIGRRIYNGEDLGKAKDYFNVIVIFTLKKGNTFNGFKQTQYSASSNGFDDFTNVGTYCGDGTYVRYVSTDDFNLTLRNGS